MVRGPNRMKGYLKMPEKTEEVFHGKWYKTGDIGKIDVEGFLHITDRLARFSKIGGEMVPHVKIEEKLEEITGEEVEIAVTGVDDEKKGEKLVVLHTETSGSPQNWIDKLREQELPKLWIPSPNDVYEVNEIPKLGTGKLDIQAVKEKARELERENK